MLTGHIGRKATAVLRGAGIRIFLGASGRVRDAIEKFKAGQYSE